MHCARMSIFPKCNGNIKIKGNSLTNRLGNQTKLGIELLVSFQLPLSREVSWHGLVG